MVSKLPYPPAFLERMQLHLGERYKDFLYHLDQASPVSIRLNPKKPFDISDEWIATHHHPQGYYLPERPSFVADPLFHAGAYYVQEASSMLLYQLVDWEQDLKILDLCAAPGGKSTLLASAMSPNSLLISNEVIRTRANILAENMIKWGNPNTIITQNDPKAFSKLKASFDLIVVDAPCSGEGMFRKDPAACDQWSPDHITHCASRQRRILADVLPALKAGGHLIYSTCTFAREENEDIITWLVQEMEMEICPYPSFTSFGAEPKEVLGIPFAAYACLFDQFPGEGFFIAKLRKASESLLDVKEKTITKRKHKQDKLIQAFIKQYLVTADLELSSFQDYLFAYTPQVANFQAKGLKLINKGVKVGKIHRKGINPTHDLALSQLVTPTLPTINLDRKQAIQYLRKEMISDWEKQKDGWYLLQYQQICLGWMKIAGGKQKNQYPMEWRIRKAL